jgi:membrane protease YdiL (CAAX protease family)
MPDTTSLPEQNLPEASSLIKLSAVIYTLMTLFGFLIIFFTVDKPWASFLPIHEPADLKDFALISGLGAGVLLIFGHLFEGWFESYRLLKTTLLEMIGPIGFSGILFLSAYSSIAEEILFRAAIQPHAGVLLTSVIFGFLHLGPDGKISSWTYWAIFAGFLMGIIYERTASIYPPVIVHFIVNFTSMNLLRREYKQMNAAEKCND